MEVKNGGLRIFLFLFCILFTLSIAVPVITVPAFQSPIKVREPVSLSFLLTGFGSWFSSTSLLEIRLEIPSNIRFPFQISQLVSTIEPTLLSQSVPKAGECFFQDPNNNQLSFTVGTLLTPLGSSISYYSIVFNKDQINALRMNYNLNDFTLICDNAYFDFNPALPQPSSLALDIKYSFSGSAGSFTPGTDTLLYNLVQQLQPPSGSTTSLTKVDATTSRDALINYAPWNGKPLYKHTISLALPQQSPKNEQEFYILTLPYPNNLIPMAPNESPIFASSTNSTIVASIGGLVPNSSEAQKFTTTDVPGWYFPTSIGAQFSQYIIRAIDFSKPILITLYTDQLTDRLCGINHLTTLIQRRAIPSFDSGQFVSKDAVFAVEPQAVAQAALLTSQVSPTSSSIPAFLPYYSTPFVSTAVEDRITRPDLAPFLVFSNTFSNLFSFQIFLGSAADIFFSADNIITMTLGQTTIDVDGITPTYSGLNPATRVTLADAQAAFLIGSAFGCGLSVKSVEMIDNKFVIKFLTTQNASACLSTTQQSMVWQIDEAAFPFPLSSPTLTVQPLYSFSFLFLQQSTQKTWETPISHDSTGGFIDRFSNIIFESSTSNTNNIQTHAFTISTQPTPCYGDIYPCTPAKYCSTFFRTNPLQVNINFDHFAQPGFTLGTIPPTGIACTMFYKVTDIAGSPATITLRYTSPTTTVYFKPTSTTDASSLFHRGPYSFTTTLPVFNAIPTIFDRAISDIFLEIPLSCTFPLTIDFATLNSKLLTIDSNVSVPQPSLLQLYVPIEYQIAEMRLRSLYQVRYPFPTTLPAIPSIVTNTALTSILSFELTSPSLYLSSELEQLISTISFQTFSTLYSSIWSTIFTNGVTFPPNMCESVVFALSTSPISTPHKSYYQNTFRDNKYSLSLSPYKQQGRVLNISLTYRTKSLTLLSLASTQLTFFSTPTNQAAFSNLFAINFAAAVQTSQIPNIQYVQFQSYSASISSLYNVFLARPVGTCGARVLQSYPAYINTLSANLYGRYLKQVLLPCPTFRKDEPNITLPAPLQCQNDFDCDTDAGTYKSQCNVQKGRCEWLDSYLVALSPQQLHLQSQLSMFDDSQFNVDVSAQAFDPQTCPRLSPYSGDWCSILPIPSNLQLVTTSDPPLSYTNPSVTTTHTVTLLTPGSTVKLTWDYTGKDTVYGQIYLHDYLSTSLGDPISPLIILNDKSATVTLPLNLGYFATPEFVLVVQTINPLSLQSQTFSTSFFFPPFPISTTYLKTAPSCFTFDLPAIKAAYEDVANVNPDINTLFNPFARISPPFLVTDACGGFGKCNSISGQCQCTDSRFTSTSQCQSDECSVYLKCDETGTKNCNLNTKQCTCNDGYSGPQCQYNNTDSCKSQTTPVCRNAGFIELDKSTRQCSTSCTCTGYFFSSDCSSCSLLCKNSGRANSRCTQCNCAAKSPTEAYVGANCGCLKSSGHITFPSQPKFMQTTMNYFPTTNDWIGKDRDYLTRNILSSPLSGALSSITVKKTVDLVIQAQSFVNEVIKSISTITKIKSIFDMISLHDSNVSFDFILNNSQNGSINYDGEESDYAFAVQASDSDTTLSLIISDIRILQNDSFDFTFDITRCPRYTTVDNTELGQSFMASVYSQWSSFVSRLQSQSMVIQNFSFAPTTNDEDEDARNADLFNTMIASFGFDGNASATEIKPYSCEDSPNKCDPSIDETEEPPPPSDPNSSSSTVLSFLLVSSLFISIITFI